jgi:hypothetical protein
MGHDTVPIDAVTRLEQSRRRLRQHLIALNGSDEGPAGSRPPGALFDSLRSSLRSIPLAGLLLDSVSGWWSQHPVRLVATLVAASVASAVRPVTQRHPRWSLFGALALGGLIVWARPWRFAPLRRAVYAGFVPQLVSKVLSRLPTDGWMTLAESLLQSTRPTPATAPAAAVRPAAHQPFPPSSGFARGSRLH